MNTSPIGKSARTAGRQLLASGMLFVALLLCVFAGNAFAVPLNDDFSHATILTARSITNTIVGSNIEATREAGEPSEVSWPPNAPSPLGARSVWWKFKPDVSSETTISTEGSTFDTQMGVYTGGSLSNLIEVASNEDAPGANDGHSAVTFATQPGVTHYVLVSGFDGAQGNIRLTVGGLTRVGDTVKPTVTVSAPTNKTSTAEALILFRGTARSRDTNDPLAQVQLEANSGEVITADGSTNWEAAVPLTPGPNTVRVRSVTQSGAESSNVVRTVTYVVMTPIVIETNGNGQVSPALNGSEVQIGSVVRLRATPASGWLFSGWTGSTNSTNATLEFLVPENPALTANFVPDPWAGVSGRFRGLIFDEAAPAHQSSGYFSVVVTNRTRYEGRFIVGGKSFTRNGSFDTNGHADFTLGQNSGTLNGSMQLDLTNNSDQITGTISNGVFVSSLLGDRGVFDGRTNLPPFAGRYNLNYLANDIVQGNGYASLTVDGSASLNMTGELADGQDISQSTTVSKGGQWPFYVSLYGGKGSAIGWINFANLPASSLTGDVFWFRPATNNSAFPEGFTNIVSALGSAFISTPTNVPVLNWTNGLAELSGGGLPMVLTNYITLRSNNTFAINFQLNNFVLSANSQGLLRGSFKHPISKRTDNIRGAVLPKTNWGGGFFLETNQSGRLLIGPNIAAGNYPSVTPPASLEGLVLLVEPTRKTSYFTNVPNELAFTSTTFTNASGEFNGAYSYSSQPGTTPNVVELVLENPVIRGRPAMIRYLLNFTSDTSGTLLGSITAGRSGTETGTFTLAGPAPEPAPE